MQFWKCSYLRTNEKISKIIHRLFGSCKLTLVMYQCVDYKICKFQMKQLGNGSSIAICFGDFIIDYNLIHTLRHTIQFSSLDRTLVKTYALNLWYLCVTYLSTICPVAHFEFFANFQMSYRKYNVT